MQKIECNKIYVMQKEKPIATVEPGEIFEVETLSAFGDRVDNVFKLHELLKNKEGKYHHHPLTGPINVNGAKVGDFIKITIEKIEILDAAQSLSQSAGINPNKMNTFGERAAYVAKVENNEATIYGQKYKLNPSIGIIALTPNEKVKTGHIGVTGGNFDNPFIAVGNSIYLPVLVDGGGIYVGDVHGLQALGELSGIALESSANVTLKAEVVTPWKPFTTHPIFISGVEPLTQKKAFAVFGIGKDFKTTSDSISDAYNQTIEVLQRIVPTAPVANIKNSISMFGNNMSGQAYSNTAESTSEIVLFEDYLRRIFKTDGKNILSEIEGVIFKNPKITEKTTIVVGCVKGRLAKLFSQYLNERGFDMSKVPSRKLTYTVENDKCILKVQLLRWEEINKNYSAFDMVFYGEDKWLEFANKSFVALEHIEQQNCRMSLLVREEERDKPISYFTTRKVATTYPNVLKSLCGVSEKNIVYMSGSVEVAPNVDENSPFRADSIFDVVETGETARMNGLIEHTKIVNFGAVLATGRVEKIPLMRNLGLITSDKKNKIIAIDGIDNSGKSTLANLLVAKGLGKNMQAVLIKPYSGGVAALYKVLWDNKLYSQWASSIGLLHWRADKCGISTVYDRSLMTAIVDMISENVNEEEIKKVVMSWNPLPEVLFYLRINAEVAYERSKGRLENDDFDNLESLAQYVEQYDKAAEMLKKFGVNVVELDATCGVNTVYQLAVNQIWR